jgi:hypothetical protein
MLALSATLYSQSGHIFIGWTLVMDGLSTALGTPVSVTMSTKGGLAAVIQTAATPLEISRSLIVVMMLAALSFAASFALPATSVPARYLLRTLSVVLALPLLGAAAMESVDPLNIESHLAQVFKLGFWFLVMMPCIFAVIAFILPGNLAKKLLIVLVAVGYFYFSVPVLALFHLHALVLLGQAVVPALNVFFTILMLSVQLIAFYGVLASQPE